MSRRFFLAPRLLVALAFATAMGAAADAVASPSQIHVYSFNATNNTVQYVFKNNSNETSAVFPFEFSIRRQKRKAGLLHGRLENY